VSAALAAIGASLSACAPHSDALTAVAGGPDCSVPIIVAFTQATGADRLAALARVAGVRITMIRPIAPTLQAMMLEADGDDAVCAAGIERLRALPNVRSVDRDQQRRIHAR
jgi:hypothetical protein